MPERYGAENLPARERHVILRTAWRCDAEILDGSGHARFSLGGSPAACIARTGLSGDRFASYKRLISMGVLVKVLISLFS
jgi:hypothetical protein